MPTVSLSSEVDKYGASRSASRWSLDSNPGVDGHLHLRITDDGGILLDLDHDRLLKLNHVGVEMWKLISCGSPEEEIVRQIASQYNVEQSRVAQDLRVLNSRLNALDLRPDHAALATENRAPVEALKNATFPWYFQDGVGSRFRAPLHAVFAAFFILMLFDLTLLLFSLKKLCLLVKACPVRTRTQPEDRTQVVGKVCSAVEEACVWYPKKALCLQRSAVTTYMLRKRGVEARLVLGVRSLPLMAHAWVEVDDQPVNDWPRVGVFYDSLTFY